MASQIDVSSIASTLDSQSVTSSMSNISSLLTASLSSNLTPSSSISQPTRSVFPNQTQSLPPTLPVTSQPAGGAAAVAAQIVQVAAIQAKKPGIGSSLQTGLPQTQIPPGASDGFPSVPSSLAPALNPVVGGASLGGGIPGNPSSQVGGLTLPTSITSSVHSGQVLPPVVPQSGGVAAQMPIQVSSLSSSIFLYEEGGGG